MVKVGNRKFLAFVLSIALYGAVMLFVIVKGVAVDLPSFAFQLGTGIAIISGPFYAGNVMAKGKGDAG